MDRKGLGKGLSALIPGGGDSGVTELDIEVIHLNPYQPRKEMDENGIQELSASIQQHGVIQPVVVRPSEDGKYQLIAGERRLRATRAAGLKTIPAVIRQMKDQQALEVALVENIQREDISPLDAARAYRRLIDEFELTQEEIATRVGKARSTVTNTLRLLQLPEAVISRLEKGEITEGHARAILSIGNVNGQILVADEVARRKCSVREAERIARSWNKASGASVPRATSTHHTEKQDPNLVAIEEQLRKFFGTRVRVFFSEDRGKIEIDFYGQDDLNRILSLIGGVYPDSAKDKQRWR